MDVTLERDGDYPAFEMLLQQLNLAREGEKLAGVRLILTDRVLVGVDDDNAAVAVDQVAFELKEIQTLECRRQRSQRAV